MEHQRARHGHGGVCGRAAGCRPCAGPVVGGVGTGLGSDPMRGRGPRGGSRRVAWGQRAGSDPDCRARGSIRCRGVDRCIRGLRAGLGGVPTSGGGDSAAHLVACGLHCVCSSRAIGPAVVTGGGGRHRTDRGSATVVILAVIGSVLLLTISGLVLASAVLASHRARSAADLAALAAAGVLMRGEPAGAACAAGAQVAAVNDALLQQCIASATEVRLSVVVPAGVKGVGVATARSRAGPGPSDG